MMTPYQQKLQLLADLCLACQGLDTPVWWNIYPNSMTDDKEWARGVRTQQFMQAQFRKLVDEMMKDAPLTATNTLPDKSRT